MHKKKSGMWFIIPILEAVAVDYIKRKWIENSLSETIPLSSPLPDKVFYLFSLAQQITLQLLTVQKTKVKTPTLSIQSTLVKPYYENSTM